MISKINRQLWVGLTAGIAGALDSASEHNGIKPSAYARQAIIKCLIQDGFMKSPAEIRKEKDDDRG